MQNIQEIFKIPNSEENVDLRNKIIYVYQVLHGLPPDKGINLFDVITWAEKSIQ